VEEGEKVGISWELALDDQLLSKVLPKLTGMGPRLDDVLRNVEDIAYEQYPMTAAKARLMREGFTKHGFASYF